MVWLLTLGFHGLLASSVFGVIITFEDLSASIGDPIPNCYNGLTWSNFFPSAKEDFNYPTGCLNAIIGDVAVFDRGFDPSPSISSALFDLNAGWFASSTDDNLNLQVEGFLNGTLLYSNVYVLSATNGITINFNYQGVDTVTFVPFGGTLHPGYQINAVDFGMDNLDVTNVHSVLISAQPSNTTALAGSSVDFEVTAYGAPPFTYQWLFNGANIDGATNSTLAVSDVQSNSEGNYSVLVSSLVDSTLSSNATLTVLASLPIFVTQPSSQTVLLGSNAIFSAGAIGSAPLAYQWQFDGTDIDGATNALLTVIDVQTNNAGYYDVLASNSLGIAQSGNATLSPVGPSVIVGWGDNNDDEGNYAGQTTIPLGLTNVLAIAAGGDHSLALNADGSVTAWGDNGAGESTVPASVTQAVAIAAGYFHSLAVQSDGTVVAWGDNSVGEINVPGGLSNVVAVAAGGCDCAPNSNHSMALRSDGTVVAWGSNADGQTNVPAGLSNVTAIAAGDAHCLALLNSGTLVGWGYNYNGQATPPEGLSNVVAISAGGYHSMALRSDGTVVVWGNNFSGQSSVPEGLSNVVAIAAGEFFSVALQNDGAVFAWGDDFFGETSIPSGLNNVIAISAGRGQCLAETNSGAPFFVRPAANQHVYSGSTVVLNAGVVGEPPLSLQWFLDGVAINDATNATLIIASAQTNNSGVYSLAASNALGVTTSNVTLTVSVTSPLYLTQPTNYFSTFGGGAMFSATATGSIPLVYQWEFNGSSIPGATNSAFNLTNITFVDAGVYSVAISNSGGVTVSSNAELILSPVVAWGAGLTNSGQNPNNGQSIIPTGLANVAAVSAGGYHSLALIPGGAVTAWGWNIYNESSVPGSVTNAVAVAAGLEHSLALRNTGTVIEWGSDSFGQTVAPASATNLAAVAAGWYHSLALTRNGSIIAWGAGKTQSVSPNLGQSIVPTNLTGVIAVAAGGYHSLALLANGTVVAWGWNASGQTNVPAGLSNVVAIAAGGSNSVALENNGTVVAWGDNTFGESTVPSGLSNVVAISAGAAHVLALGSDGTATAWGLDANGQIDIPQGLTNVEAISAGAYHSLALVNSGAVAFLNQPQSQSVYVGASVTFASACLGAPPLSYQWLEDGSNIFDATSNMLTIPDAQLTNAGAYQLVVSNSFGAVTSAVAALSVTQSTPVITVQPVALSVIVGSNATFSVTVSGAAPISFQWQFDAADLPDATNSVLTLTNVQQNSAGSYLVIASNSYGTTESSSVVLSVVSLTNLAEVLNSTNLVFTSSGATPWVGETTVSHDGVAAARSTTVTDGQESTLQTTVIGPGALNFWWMMSSSQFNALRLYVNGTNVASIEGTPGVPTPAGWQEEVVELGPGTNVLQWIYVEVSSSPGEYGWLDQASYVAGAVAPAVAAGPANQTIPAGTSATFGATGEGTPPIYYQWQFDGTSIIGATNSSIVFPDVQAANQGTYTVIVSNSYGPPATASAFLTVTPTAPTITAQPYDWQMVPGGYVNFQVAARGTEPLVYQWFFNGTALPGATNSVLHFAGVEETNAGTYQVSVSNIYGAPLSSNVTLTLAPSVVVAWGGDTFGETPAPLGLTNVVALAPGWYHCLALRSDGTLAGWGWNGSGQATVPAGLSNVVAAAAGYDHSLALLNNGTVIAWGDNSFGETNVPSGLTNVISIAAGYASSLALKSDGTVLGWGWNQFGQITPPAGLTNVAAIAAGEQFYLALQSNGLVQAWGWPGFNETSVPAGLSNVVAIAAGQVHCLALESDRTLVGWGFPGLGDTTAAPGVTNPVTLAAGFDCSLALQGEGTVVGWGFDANGDIDVPSGLTNAVAIGLGAEYGVALLSSGSPVITWQPRSQTVETAETVVLGLGVTGSQPLFYQWQYDGTNLAGATNSVLVLTNVPFSAAGAYNCIATNSLGAVSSAPATLLILRSTPSFGGAPTFSSNGFALQMNQLSGHGPIIVEVSTNLVNWVPLLTNPPVTGSFQLLDSEATNQEYQFYRAIEQ